MFIIQQIVKVDGSEGLPLSNSTARLKPRRPYAAFIISPSRAGRWRSTKLAPERIALVSREIRHHLRLAQEGFLGRTSLRRQGAAVVRVASSVQMRLRGGTASVQIARWNQSV